MFTKKYTHPITIHQLSKLHNCCVRVHFLSDDDNEHEYIGDRICSVTVSNDDIFVRDENGIFLSFKNYSKSLDYSLIIKAGVLIYRLPKIPYDIQW